MNSRHGINPGPTRMYHRIIGWLIFTLAVAAVQAQSGVPASDVPFDKEHVADANSLKTALAAMKKADALAFRGGVDHAAAMAAYEEAHAINPDNAELNHKMGVCLLNGPEPHKALPYLQRAAELDPYRQRIHFLLGYALQLNARWDEAIAEFQRHGEVIRRMPDPDPTYNRVEKHLAECRSGKTLMANPTLARVTNLGDRVNTGFGEYGALVDGKGNLYFTSKRPGTTGGKVNRVNNTWFEDVYHSRWEADGWSEARPVTQGLNTTHNDATVSLSADGRSMILYRDEKNGGDLYISERIGAGWATPQPLPGQVNSPAQESSAWRSGDGQWLYFVSSREGGLGGSDIYRSPWDKEQGSWGPAENLGPDINTAYDEEGVYAPGDGNTIYYASQGHNSMGGYDLFRSSFANGRWSKPENLGWPINSPGDDQFLVLAADGRTGYFSSVRPGGLGEDDLYQVEMPADVQVQQDVMLVSAGNALPLEDEKHMRLVGFIKGLKMMEAVEATIALLSVDEPDYNMILKPDPATGEFSAEVPAGKQYALHVKADGYLLYSGHVATGEGEQRVEVEMTPAIKGNTGVMRNIFFENSSYRLDSVSVVELRALLAFLEEHPEIRLEVGGHTDSDVGALPNQELSQARAQVVVNWLVRHGVLPDRLEAMGYGATMPVVPNDSPANKARNRRTEIRVL